MLVHCGAGSSRSAALCAAYIMRKQRKCARDAVQHLRSLRSSVSPNEGFWRQLCAFEAELGLPPAQRSDVDKPPAVNESFGQLSSADVAVNAAGSKVDVQVSAKRAGDESRRQDAEGERDDGVREPCPCLLHFLRGTCQRLPGHMLA